MTLNISRLDEVLRRLVLPKISVGEINKNTSAAQEKSVGAFFHVTPTWETMPKCGKKTAFYSVGANELRTNVVYPSAAAVAPRFYTEKTGFKACGGSARRLRRALVQTLRTSYAQHLENRSTL